MMRKINNQLLVTVGNEKIPEKKTETFINCRNVLWIMTFTAFAIDSMVRININMTIVEMIAPKDNKIVYNLMMIPTDSKKLYNFIPECYNLTTPIRTFNNTIVDSDVVRIQPEKYSIEKEFLKFIKYNFTENGFSWNEYEQGLILGSFYWLNWITQIPGGILARKYGSKIVCGLSVFLPCILSIFIPIFSYIDIRLAMIVRMVQGFIEGFLWPGMHHIAAQWIPPNERGKFFSSYMGCSIGSAIFFPIFGYIMAWTSWEWVYHFCFITGIVWYMCWLYLIYDSPKEHPRISTDERKHIETELAALVEESKNLPTPWKSIFTSKPVWINAFIQFGSVWGNITLITEGPTYLSAILGWSTSYTGILNGLPQLFRMIFSYICSHFADSFLQSNRFSRKTVRIGCGLIANVGFGIFMLGLAFSGCNSTGAISFMILAELCSGAISSSAFANLVDLSPNYAGVLMGLCGTVCIMAGIASPYLAGLLTFENQSLQQWNYVFVITALVLIVTGIQYALFTEVNVQKWNNQSVLESNNEVNEKCSLMSQSSSESKIEPLYGSFGKQ